MHIRRNDTAFKVVRNANTSGLSESPIISQNKLPERQFNGLGSSHAQHSHQRPESFRIRQNNANFAKNVQ